MIYNNRHKFLGSTLAKVGIVAAALLLNSPSQALQNYAQTTEARANFIANAPVGKRNIDAFVNRFNGVVGITRYDTNTLNGQCVTLVARYLQEYYGASRTALYLDNGRGTARSVANQFSGSFKPVSDPADPIPGSVMSFPNAPFSGSCGSQLCGHVALVVSSTRSGNLLNLTILHSNDDGRAPNTRVTLKNITINTSNFSASGYGSGIYWVNPRN